MFSPSVEKRRIDNDVIKLIESKHVVTILSGLNKYQVMFFGPKDIPYEGGFGRFVSICARTIPSSRQA